MGEEGWNRRQMIEKGACVPFSTTLHENKPQWAGKGDSDKEHVPLHEMGDKGLREKDTCTNPRHCNNLHTHRKLYTAFQSKQKDKECAKGQTMSKGLLNFFSPQPFLGKETSWPSSITRTEQIHSKSNSNHHRQMTVCYTSKCLSCILALILTAYIHRTGIQGGTVDLE